MTLPIDSLIDYLFFGFALYHSLPHYTTTERREDTLVLDTVVLVSTELTLVAEVMPVDSITTESSSINTTLVTSERFVRSLHIGDNFSVTTLIQRTFMSEI